MAKPDSILILPYRGFGNQQRFYLKGRVLEDEGVYGKDIEGRLENLFHNLRRFESDEVAGARLNLHVGTQQHETLTDEEGYFTIHEEWQHRTAADGSQWINAELHLKEGENPPATTAEVLVPSPLASFGVISDIDDTVLQTHVTSRLKLKMLYASFFKDSHQRQPMEGMPELLRALTKGGNGQQDNPVFYVSDSPWNIYDLLADFLDRHQVPKGPILLRDYGLHMLRRKSDRPIHKLDAFRLIMGMYPDLPFVMLGDTASKDADYYLQMAEEFGNRVRAIYIRHTRNTANARRISDMLAANSHLNAVMIKNSGEIWEHAKSIGLLSSGSPTL